MQSVLRAPVLVAHGFAHGFSTRHAGGELTPFALPEGAHESSEAAKDRRRFAAEVGYEPARLFSVTQVHGRAVALVNDAHAREPHALRAVEADGLVAGAGSGAIAVRTADCVPLLLADPETRQVAALHGGWRGLEAGIIAAGVRALCERSGAPAGRLLAALFPHIGACCFEVGDDVAAQLQAASPDGRLLVQPGPRGKPHVALDQLALAQLTAAGLDPSRLERVPGCTRCDADTFFSFRRDGRGFGSHWTVIVAG